MINTCHSCSPSHSSSYSSVKIESVKEAKLGKNSAENLREKCFCKPYIVQYMWKIIPSLELLNNHTGFAKQGAFSNFAESFLEISTHLL